MARDRPGFFAGDGDFDMCGDFEDLVGFDMHDGEDDKTEERVRELNDGKLTEVFDQLYQDYKDDKKDKSWMSGGGERPLVLFCLMAMELGAIFKSKQLGALRRAARDLDTEYEELLVLTAVDEYKNNGTPWVVESARDPENEFGEGGLGHSADEPPYPHLESKTCVRCGKHNPTRPCSKCKIARYCDQDCQRADSRLHKKTCSSYYAELV